MEDSKEEENGWISHLRERRTASWRHTRSKVRNVVTEQPMRNNGRERTSKKNALYRIKLINELNSKKAANKNRKFQNSSDGESETWETWNDTQKIDTLQYPAQLKEDPKPIQPGRSRRKIPPHLNRFTESLQVTQDQDLQTHLVSDEGFCLKSEDDMEFLHNPIKSDEGSDDYFDPLQGQEEVLDVNASFPFKAEMDPIKSEVEDNKDSILTKLAKTVKMEIDETKLVYPVALISVKRQSEPPDLKYFNPSHDHSVELVTCDTNGKIQRNEEEADNSEEDSNDFTFVSLDEASNEMEPEEMESSCQLKTDSANSQQQEVVSEMPVNNVEKTNQFSDNTCKVISMEEFSNIPIALPCTVRTLNENAEYEEFVLVPSTQGNKSEPRSEPPISKPVIDKTPISQLAINNPSLNKHSTSKYNSKVASTGVHQRRPINILSKRRRPNVQNVQNVINLPNQQFLFLPEGQLVLLPNKTKNNVAMRFDTFS